MQGFSENMEISFMKYGSFMQKFAPFETFVKSEKTQKAIRKTANIHLEKGCTLITKMANFIYL